MKNYKGHMNFNIWWLVKLEILLVLDGYVMLGFALDWDQLWGFDEDILIVSKRVGQRNLESSHYMLLSHLGDNASFMLDQ